MCKVRIILSQRSLFHEKWLTLDWPTIKSSTNIKSWKLFSSFKHKSYQASPCLRLWASQFTWNKIKQVIHVPYVVLISWPVSTSAALMKKNSPWHSYIHILARHTFFFFFSSSAKTGNFPHEAASTLRSCLLTPHTWLGLICLFLNVASKVEHFLTTSSIFLHFSHCRLSSTTALNPAWICIIICIPIYIYVYKYTVTLPLYPIVHNDVPSYYHGV